MSVEDRRREYLWAIELYESRRKFAARCRTALYFRHDPKARRAHYEEWRKKYGDASARECAKFVEAIIKGTVSLEPIEEMIKVKPTPEMFSLYDGDAVFGDPAEKGANANADLPKG